MADLVGQDIGRYRIVAALGEGGMATVYRAFDARLQREVAVKFIRVDQITPAQMPMMLKRFEIEAHALARLEHPNIVRVYDYGEYQNAPYVVMQYLAGGTLKQKTGRALPYPEAARLLAPVARALEYAHSQNIIHRDVKPANILLTPGGVPMLSDFGIAKILEAEQAAHLTGTGVGLGTPEYMAPEQGMGNRVGPQADVYSLGVVFYELVTGRRPFTAETPLAVVLKHIHDPLPPPHSLVPDLPGTVEGVVFKAMAKTPAERYSSMGLFAAALEGLAQGGQTAERPAAALSALPTAATTRKAAHFHLSPWLAGGAGLLLLGALALVVGGGLWFWRSQSVSPADRTATARANSSLSTAAARTITAATARVQSDAAALARCAAAYPEPDLVGWKVFGCDNFSDNKTGWPVGNYNDDYIKNGNQAITANKYILSGEALKGVTWFHKNAYDPLTDFSASLNARRTAGAAASACYGIIFRYDEKRQDYYLFQVCDDQQFKVNLSTGGQLVTLSDWSKSSTINANGTNRLGVTGQGSRFKFFINQKQVAELNEARYKSGCVGLFGTAAPGERFAFEFDNFVVRVP